MGQIRLAQQEKAFAEEYDVLCSIPRTLTVQRIHFPKLSSTSIPALWHVPGNMNYGGLNENNPYRFICLKTYSLVG